MDKKISVVIPVYNEEENLNTLYNEIVRVLDELALSYEIIFVNDASTDGSLSILKRLASKNNSIHIISFAENCGQTAAFDAGFKTAKGDIVVTMDADLQNDPQDIPKLLEKIGEYDMVCGWRWQRKDSFKKKISSKIANIVRRKCLGDRFKDIGCSLKVYKKQCLDKIKLYNGLHRFLPILFEMEGFKVAEVKVNHRPRRFGETKYSIRNRLFKAYRDMKIVRWLRKNKLNYQIKDEK